MRKDALILSLWRYNVYFIIIENIKYILFDIVSFVLLNFNNIFRSYRDSQQDDD